MPAAAISSARISTTRCIRHSVTVAMASRSVNSKVCEPGNRIVVSYTVGDAKILENHQLTDSGGFVRHLNIGKSSKDLTLRIANAGVESSVKGNSKVRMRDDKGFVIATVPARYGNFSRLK